MCTTGYFAVCIYSLIHDSSLLIHVLLIYSCVCLFFPSWIHACIHSFNHSFFQSFIHSFILSFIHICIYECIYFFLFFQIGIIKDILNIPSYVLPMPFCSRNEPPPSTQLILQSLRSHQWTPKTCRIFPWIWSVGNLIRNRLKKKKHLPSRKLTYPQKNGILKMIFLFPRWDMLIPWRVPLLLMEQIPNNQLRLVVSLSVFIGFYTFHVVQNFFHQQYHGSSGWRHLKERGSWKNEKEWLEWDTDGQNPTSPPGVKSPIKSDMLIFSNIE